MGLSGDAAVKLALQWGRAFVGAEMPQGRGRGSTAATASMGPRLCGRGDPKHGGWRQEPPEGFNGAAPLWARRWRTPCVTEIATPALQWGRAFVGAEIRAGGAGLLVTTSASMGPRLCGRGDAAFRQKWKPAICGLQWGRAFVGAEIRWLQPGPRYMR